MKSFEYGIIKMYIMSYNFCGKFCIYDTVQNMSNIKRRNIRRSSPRVVIGIAAFSSGTSDVNEEGHQHQTADADAASCDEAETCRASGMMAIPVHTGTVLVHKSPRHGRRK